MAFSPSGQQVASCCDDRTVRIWSTLPRQTQTDCELVFWGHQARVWRVTWLDEHTVVSAGEDAQVFIWNTLNPDQKRIVNRFQNVHDGKNIWSLAVHPHERIIASGGADGQVRLLQEPQLTTLREILPLLNPTKLADPLPAVPKGVQPRPMAVTEDGKLVIFLSKLGFDIEFSKR